jgi:hypothetical protein
MPNLDLDQVTQDFLLLQQEGVDLEAKARVQEA